MSEFSCFASSNSNYLQPNFDVVALTLDLPFDVVALISDLPFDVFALILDLPFDVL